MVAVFFWKKAFLSSPALFLLKNVNFRSIDLLNLIKYLDCCTKNSRLKTNELQRTYFKLYVGHENDWIKTIKAMAFFITVSVLFCSLINRALWNYEVKCYSDYA